MGQLDVYSIEDISVLTVMSGPASTYLAEEIEASIESIVPYFYSHNILKKKRLKLLSHPRYSGDVNDAIQLSWNYLPFIKFPFFTIWQPIDSKTMWQDPYLSQWEGAATRKNLSRLSNKYFW